MPSRERPWLAPLHLPAEMRAELEMLRERLSSSVGVAIPKTAFVRMLLERGARAVEEEQTVAAKRKSKEQTSSAKRRS